MKTHTQIKREEDARAQLRRSARGRLAMVCKRSGTSDANVRVKPVRRLSRDERIDTLMQRFSRHNLWDILGRIDGDVGSPYCALTKRYIAQLIVEAVATQPELTRTGLDAACALPLSLCSVGAFCWVLNPECA